MALGLFTRSGRSWMHKAKRTPESIFGNVKASRRATPASTSESGQVAPPRELPDLRSGREAGVWTALPPKLETATGIAPSEDEVMDYIRGLTGARRTVAEQYVRRTPRQINTAFRRRMEAEFNWVAASGEI